MSFLLLGVVSTLLFEAWSTDVVCYASRYPADGRLGSALSPSLQHHRLSPRSTISRTRDPELILVSSRGDGGRSVLLLLSRAAMHCSRLIIGIAAVVLCLK